MIMYHSSSIAGNWSKTLTLIVIKSQKLDEALRDLRCMQNDAKTVENVMLLLHQCRHTTRHSEWKSQMGR